MLKIGLESQPMKSIILKIQKWGSSLGLRILMPLVKQLNLHPGSSVTIKVEEEGRLCYDLKTMVDSITSKNQHHQLLEDDTQTGNEEW